MEYFVLVIVMLLLFSIIKFHQEPTTGSINNITRLIKKYKIAKIFIILFAIMLSIYTLEIISANISLANNDANTTIESTDNKLIATESKKFLSDFYGPVFQKNIDVNKLSADSIKKLYSELLNMCPTKGPINEDEIISSKFGFRKTPFARFHNGIDIKAIYGESVYSTMSGTIENVGYAQGYGNNILIKNEIGFETRYAHLDKMLVTKGQKIEKNQLIGTVGLTGNSTGVNLHYEVIQNNDFKDPQIYILMGTRNISKDTMVFKINPINIQKLKGLGI